MWKSQMGSNIKEFLNDIKENEQNEKRLDYIHWDEYFMAMTFLELRRSTSKKISDSAIILNKRKIIISMASHNVPEEESDILNNVHTNHAEYKALKQIKQGHVIYTTTFPCFKCAECIKEAGIEDIIYYRDSANSDEAKNLLDQCGITHRQFFSKGKKIEIDFSQYCDKE